MVWCHDAKCAAVLLGLKPPQWNQLILLLPRVGEVVYRYNKDEQSQVQVRGHLHNYHTGKFIKIFTIFLDDGTPKDLLHGQIFHKIPNWSEDRPFIQELKCLQFIIN